MDGLLKTTSNLEDNKEFSFWNFFIPLTTLKAINIIVFVGIIVYFGSLFNGFVWDDFPFLIQNQDLHSINIFYLFGKNLFNVTSFYRPIPALYYALIYSLSGTQPFLYHFIQVVIHCINACLLFLFFKRFVTKPVSLFLSLIFLIHPINVESVAYISAADSELCLFFGLLALLISFKSKFEPVQVLLVCGLLLLSLLSKEMGAAFLFLIVLYQILFSRSRVLKFFFIELASLVIYVLLRFGYAGIFYTKEITLYPVPIENLTLMQRLQNVPEILFYYFSNIFFPSRLAVSQRWVIPGVTINDFYLPLLIDSILLFILIVGSILIYKKEIKFFNIYMFFFAWFLSGLFFILQIIPLELTVADHWMYFPIVGLIGMLGVGIEILINKLEIKERLFARTQDIKNLMVIVGVLIIVLLSFRTFVRITNYHDELTLYTHDSTIYDDWEVENDLGSDFALTGNMKDAFKHFKMSVDLHPSIWNQYDLGLYYENTGDYPKALSYYYNVYNIISSKSFSSTNQYQQGVLVYDIYLHLANTLLIVKNYSSSIEFSKKGLVFYPSSSDLWVDLAISEYYMNNKNDALFAATKASLLAPNQNNTYLYTQIKNNKPLKLKMN